MGRVATQTLGEKAEPTFINDLRNDYVSQTDTNPQFLQGGSLSWLEKAKALPLMGITSTSGVTTVSYENGYIKTVNASGQYPAIRTGQSIQHLYELNAYAYLKVDNPQNTFPFFFEPSKGDYDNFQGFEAVKVFEPPIFVTYYYARSHNGGVETGTFLNDQNWTKETKYAISHMKNQSACDFYIDNTLVAHHTTNISAQPYEICCCEPAGEVRTFYLKYPPGIAIGP